MVRQWRVKGVKVVESQEAVHRAPTGVGSGEEEGSATEGSSMAYAVAASKAAGRRVRSLMAGIIFNAYISRWR